MVVLIDNGHGINTLGKRSPNDSLLEYEYTRMLAKCICDDLQKNNVKATRIVTEETDISLKERCLRANEICRKVGKENVILVSLHINAFGDGASWHHASGFSVYVSPNSSLYSRALSKSIWTRAISLGLEGNRCVPQDYYISQNLAICRDTLCPAVLTESLFMDNKKDLEFLLSPNGLENLIRVHVEGILNFINKCSTWNI